MLAVQTVSHCFNECESVTVNVFLSSGAIRLNSTQRLVQRVFVIKRSASHWFVGYFRVRRWTPHLAVCWLLVITFTVDSISVEIGSFCLACLRPSARNQSTAACLDI